MGEGKPDIGFQTELIGREKEFHQLRDRWDDVVNGRGSTILISGEAGIGKTRLVNELMGSARDEDALMIKGWCLADTPDPLIPFRAAFREAGLYHLMANRSPPKVVSVYLMDDSRLMIAKVERKTSDLDADIFTSMLNAVANFVSDSLSMMGEDRESKLNAIGYGDHDILIQMMGDMSLAVVIEGESSEFLIADMRTTLKTVNQRSSDWDGSSSTSELYKNDIEWFVTSGKYEGRYLVDDPKLRQENLFDNILLGLRRLSVEQPVILFLDDLQWADPTSLRLLHYLSRNTVNDRILILGAYRPEDILESPREDRGVTNHPGTEKVVHPFKTTMQNMSREDLFMEIKLKRLDEAKVKEMISKTLGEVDLDEDFVNIIYRESEGNPFFLMELTRMLVEEGHIKDENGDWNQENAAREKIHTST